METSDTFERGETLTPEFVAEFLARIDCYVMGSRTYETALDFEAKGLGCEGRRHGGASLRSAATRGVRPRPAYGFLCAREPCRLPATNR
jgi:hypothetical protein